MKNLLLLTLVLTSLSLKAQLNFKTAFGNLCASGQAIHVKGSRIFTSGVVCQPYGTNQFIQRSYLAEYDLNGNLNYLDDFIGDTVQKYFCTNILSNDSEELYLIGNFTTDSSGSHDRLGLFIQKRDSNNQVLWTLEKRDSLPYVRYFVRDADLLDNGNIAITGFYELEGDSIQPGNPGFPDYDIFLIIFDQFGNHLLTQRFGDNTSQDLGYSIKSDGPNSILLGGGRNFTQGIRKSWVIQCDYQGNIINDYSSSISNLQPECQVIRINDGGVVFATTKNNGTTSNTYYRVYLEKLDSNFNKEWHYEKKTQWNPNSIVRDIGMFQNGDIFIGGTDFGPILPNDTPGTYGFIQRINLQGDSVWHNFYRILNNHIYYEYHTFNEIKFSNGKLLMIGETLDYLQPIPPQQEMWLVTADSNGVVSSNKSFEFIEETIAVYPNPVQDLLSIKLNSDLNESVFKLFDLQGRILLQKELNEGESTVSLSSMAKGLYIYEVQNGELVKRGKVVKN